MVMGNLVTMKKILTILAAACAIHCFCIATPMHGGDNTETFLSHSTMTNEQLREKLIMALDDMKAKAIIYPGSSWTIVDSEDVLGVNLNIKPKR